MLKQQLARPLARWMDSNYIFISSMGFIIATAMQVGTVWIWLYEALNSKGLLCIQELAIILLIAGNRCQDGVWSGGLHLLDIDRAGPHAGPGRGKEGEWERRDSGHNMKVV